MMGSCERNDSVRLSILRTFNIWEVAAKAQHAASNQLQQLEELLRMPHMLMRIWFGHQYDGCLVCQSIGAVAGEKIYESKSLLYAKPGCKKATKIMCSQIASGPTDKAISACSSRFDGCASASPLVQCLGRYPQLWHGSLKMLHNWGIVLQLRAKNASKIQHILLVVWCSTIPKITVKKATAFTPN